MFSMNEISHAKPVLDSLYFGNFSAFFCYAADLSALYQRKRNTLSFFFSQILAILVFRLQIISHDTAKKIKVIPFKITHKI
jgi:hypothetical protein